MTDLLWASLIAAPAALVGFVPFWTYLYLVVTKRTLRPGWVRTVALVESGHPKPSPGGIVLAITIVAFAALVATALVVDGAQRVPMVPIAILSGSAALLLAVAWCVLLIRASSSELEG